MPHFRLVTNVPQDQIPPDLPQKLCGVLSHSLGKPLNHCSAAVIGGVSLVWGGTNEPAAQASLLSIGSMGLQLNRKHSKALFELIGKELNIASDRMFVNFIDAQPSAVGYKGTTCHDLFNL